MGCGGAFSHVILTAIAIAIAIPLAACDTPPVLFVFGDSNSDTGGLASGLGFTINLPNGRTFFGRSTGRLSDGRLVIDLLCQSTFPFPSSHFHFLLPTSMVKDIFHISITKCFRFNN
ncbi:hypothetical protein V8G54_019879 [Vigna mungo]|uniref:GDSL esterase/lipase n=1 Tax=Vigna mungo TaxID=3915 RepID=A0AAQ3NEI5_VIGMU